MSMGKFLSFLILVLITSAAEGLLLCENLIPSSCSNKTGYFNVNSNRVYGCSGGTLATEFEVWGGCGPNAGLGGYNDPREQEPSGVQPATNAAGRYCYCQLKSINGGANLPWSSRWVFADAYGNAGVCADICAYNCAAAILFYSGFRSTLFSAAGY
jgi:hypothetical protein